MGRVYPKVGKVNTKSDVVRINQKIRKSVRNAKSKARLSELFKRSSYLITLTYSKALPAKLRSTAKSEFTKTAKLINQKAKSLGLKGNFDIHWGK